MKITTECGCAKVEKASEKEMISIRLDKEVLSVLRKGGPGWQTRLNEQLRKLVLK